jgi:hypothetical protein
MNQFAHVCYFDSGLPPRPGTLSKIWNELGFHGPLLAHAGFWSCDATLPVITRQARLGDLEAALDKNEVLLYQFGGGAIHSTNDENAAHKHADILYALGHEREHGDFMAPADSIYVVSQDVYIRNNAISMLQHFHRLFAILDESRPVFGFIEVAPSNHIYDGDVYGTVQPLHAPLNRIVESAKWQKNYTDRKLVVHGVHWGNYIGLSLLDRLGGKSKYLKLVHELSSDNMGNPSAHVWEFPNGVFLSLSVDPLDVVSDSPARFQINMMVEELVHIYTDSGVM